MLLYQSFPRPGINRFSDAELDKLGVAQLALMMEYGLLLTPEDLIIPQNPKSTRPTRPREVFSQTRACFTLARRDELWNPQGRFTREGHLQSHSALFGRFAIGLDAVSARRLGAVPVIYFYELDDLQHVNVSQEILYRLRELRVLSIALAHLEAKAELADRDVLDNSTLASIGYTLDDEPGISGKISHTTKQFARSVVDLLDTDRVASWSLVDWIDTMLDFFQTADSGSSRGSLAYYQQREWRIVRLYGPHVRCYSLGEDHYHSRQGRMPVEEKQLFRTRLRSVNSSFFSDKRLDESAILMGIGDIPFFDFVKEIVCPMEAAYDVMAMVKDAGLTNRYRIQIREKESVTIFENVESIE